MGSYRKIILFSLLGTIIFYSYGCGRSDSANKKDIIAYVNNDPIYKSDLMRDIALRAQLDPSFKVTPDIEGDQLDMIIDRKLIVQYAMEKGLAREERFVNTIRTIWEHTLIRDFIEYKKRELSNYLFATNDDIAKYYNNMSQKVTFNILKSKDKRFIEEAYKKYLVDKDISGWQTIGPMRYEEIGSTVLLEAFEMDKGQAKRFEDEPTYYIIEVANKENVVLESMENLSPEIEKRVMAMKEKCLFEDWLKERKKNSRINIINKDFLKKQPKENI